MMNRLILLLLVYLSLTDVAFAEFVCEDQPSSNLHSSRVAQTSNNLNINTTNRVGTWGHDFGLLVMKSEGLIKCRNTLVTIVSGSGKVARFSPFSSESNLEESSNPNGLLYYYKLKNTENDFLNTHGYISFWYRDSFGFWVGTPNQQINFSTTSLNQNIEFTQIRFNFTGTPTQPIVNVPINLGTLTVSMKPSVGGTEVTKSQSVKIWLNMTSTPVQTCSIEDRTINLPIITASQLGASGTEAGATNFSISAKCNPQGVARILTGRMIDNNNLNNTTSILTNSVGESNVGIKVKDLENNLDIFYNTGFDFGTTSNSNSEVTITKNFSASYYKIDSLPTVTGEVRAQAVLSVTYP